MKRKVDWVRVAMILALGAAVVGGSILLGKSPIGYALGGEIPIQWSAPVGNCDNTRLTDLTGYRVRWGSGQTELPAEATGYTITGLPPGLWWVNVAAFNSKNQESQYVAGWLTVTPEQFVTTGTNVYTFVKATDRVLLLKVGTVPLGVQCDATTSVNGKYAVPVARVTWSGSTRPAVVVGDCG